VAQVSRRDRENGRAVHEKQPCKAIQHYTDAVGEAEVARSEAITADNRALIARADKLRSKAFNAQKRAITACKRTARPRKKS
jgi:hypothetical protein